MAILEDPKKLVLESSNLLMLRALKMRWQKLGTPLKTSSYGKELAKRKYQEKKVYITRLRREQRQSTREVSRTDIQVFFQESAPIIKIK